MSCGRSEDAPPPRLHATVYRPPKDTIQFSLPAIAHVCQDRRWLLLESAAAEGSGMLVRLRYGDSLVEGAYPVVIPNDTTTVPAATVAVRYLLHAVPHAYGFDSGAVVVRRDRGRIAADVNGWGFESAIRTPAKAEYRDVQVAADTVPCMFQP